MALSKKRVDELKIIACDCINRGLGIMSIRCHEVIGLVEMVCDHASDCEETEHVRDGKRTTEAPAD
jgi:hypothetical protein